MADPEWLSQCGEPLTREQRSAWFRARTLEAKSAGATHARYSLHETIPDLILFEAWRIRPKDEGEPRWMLVAKEPADD